jgi:predicted nucleotidyltransferase
MQTQREFFKTIVDLLAKAGIEYMVSGSIASTVYGEPRTTNDIDIVIDPNEQKLKKFLELIGKGYYFSETSAIDALKNRSMFNIIDVQCGWKIDLIIKKSRPFEILEFRRKINAEVLGPQAFIVSPEDSIISKLAWSKRSQSQTHIRDVLGVLVNQYEQLDFEYLEKWAAMLGLSDSLKELIRQAEEIRGRQQH